MALSRNTRRRLGVIGRISLFAVLVCSPSLAQEKTAAPSEEPPAEETPPAAAGPEETRAASTQPWAVGIAAADQAAALASFKKGNSFFGERQYSDALKHYEEALSHWKHPAIHFNTAVCQINLDQPIQAHEHINAALEFQDAPLGAELYAQGLTYKKLLSDRLGQVTVKAADKGAKVTLDGEDLLVAPDEKHLVVLPGKHQIVAELSGYLTFTRAVQVDPGAPTVVEVTMVPVGEATEYERPMATWLPWTIMGGGAVVGAVGYMMRTTAATKIQRYDDFVSQECQSGCTEDQIPDAQNDALKSGRVWDAASIATMSVGGAALLTGVTLLILNSPRPVQAKDRTSISTATLSPQVGRHGARLDLSMRF